MNQVDVYSDESLDRLFGFEEESEYDYEEEDDYRDEGEYCSVEIGRSYSSIEEEYTEYLITLTFLEDGFAKLSNADNVGYSIDAVLCKKRHMYREDVLDFTMLSITKKHMIFMCKARVRDLDIISNITNGLKSDLSCLTVGKVFKKQHHVEENEIVRLYDKSYDNRFCDLEF